MAAKTSGESGSLSKAMANKTSAQLDAEIAEALTRSTSRRKRKAFDINPSSPEVVQAFLKTGWRVDDVSIQDFVAQRYGSWVSQQRETPSDKLYGVGIWQWIIDEFTEALRAHGVHIEEDR